MKTKRTLLSHVSLTLVGLSMATFATATNVPETYNAPKAAVASAARQVYAGSIIYFTGRGGSSVSTFRLTIDNFTPEAEVARLGELLKSGGQDALMKAVTKEKRGTIQIGTQLGRDINAVWVSEGPEGERKITALSERWIGVFETRRGSRSLDYPFTFIELYIESNGKGDGEMIPAAKLRVKDSKNWEVENFGIYPARLVSVRFRTK